MIKRALKKFICTLFYNSGLLYLLSRRKGVTVTILMYHRIVDKADPLGLSIRPELFEHQISYLVSRYSVVSLNEAVESLERGTPRAHVLVITFDDGYRDNYSFAFPILKKYSVPATIFVTCGAVDDGYFHWERFDEAVLGFRGSFLDLREYGFGKYPLGSQPERGRTLFRIHEELKRGGDALARMVMEKVVSEAGIPFKRRTMLEWEEIREMARSGLVTIGSHTVTHPILTKVSKARALHEIAESKRVLERNIGLPVDYFAYPNGRYADFDDEIVKIVKAAGYRAACATIPGHNSPSVDPFMLKRIDITPGVSENREGKISYSMFAVRISGILDGILFRS